MVFFARQVHVNYMGLSLSATDSWVRRAPPYHTDNLLALVSSEISATEAPANIQHHRVASGFSDTGKTLDECPWHSLEKQGDPWSPDSRPIHTSPQGKSMKTRIQLAQQLCSVNRDIHQRSLTALLHTLALWSLTTPKRAIIFTRIVKYSLVFSDGGEIG